MPERSPMELSCPAPKHCEYGRKIPHAWWGYCNTRHEESQSLIQPFARPRSRVLSNPLQKLQTLVARSRWPGPVARSRPGPGARSRWPVPATVRWPGSSPGPGGRWPGGRWPGPGGPVSVARSRWPGPGPALRARARGA